MVLSVTELTQRHWPGIRQQPVGYNVDSLWCRLLAVNTTWSICRTLAASKNPTLIYKPCRAALQLSHCARLGVAVLSIVPGARSQDSKQKSVRRCRDVYIAVFILFTLTGGGEFPSPPFPSPVLPSIPLEVARPLRLESGERISSPAGPGGA